MLHCSLLQCIIQRRLLMRVYFHSCLQVAMLQKVQSPYVVQFMGVSLTADHRLVLLTEFMVRGDLFKAIQRRQINWYRR